MLTNFQKVRDFNISFGIGRSKTPNEKLFKLRWDLIEEESNELFQALGDKDYVEIIDAVSDILYVIHGAADSFEEDLDVHLNNENENLFEKKFEKKFELPQNIKEMPFSHQRMNIIFRDEYEKLRDFQQEYSYHLANLKVSFDTQSLPEIIPNLVIIHNYLYMWAYLFGFNLDETFDLVHQSNMSKLAETEEVAQNTVKWYLENEKRYDSPAYRLSPVKFNDEPRWVIYNQNTGKALKSINYHAVDFVEYFNKF